MCLPKRKEKKVFSSPEVYRQSVTLRTVFNVSFVDAMLRVMCLFCLREADGTFPEKQKENSGMSQATNYDAIVIGTSQSGRLLPIALAKAGRKVALIERDHIGGVCVNVGCTPTKTMVAQYAVYDVRFLGANSRPVEQSARPVFIRMCHRLINFPS